MDALTGLSNRAGMDRALVAAISRYARHGEPFGVLMLDLDHFKSINDTYGHGTGDEMLRKVAAAIAATCRPYDQAARYGGEEFTLVLGRAGGKEAQRASGRVLQEVRKAAIRVADRTLSVTCSAGLVVVPDKSGDLQPDLLLQQADAALYEAKTQGRDRLVVKPYAVPHTS